VEADADRSQENLPKKLCGEIGMRDRTGFYFGKFAGLRGYPPPPWSIGIINLRGNEKINLVAQRVAGKILILKSLGVANVARIRH
jgi:hypothetical protein